MYFGADHAKSLSAWVDIMQSWFDCSNVSAKFLINAIVALGDSFVGILDEAATQTGTPCPCESTALTPGVQTCAVEGELRLVGIAFGELYVFRFAGESLVLILHIESL